MVIVCNCNIYIYIHIYIYMWRTLWSMDVYGNMCIYIYATWASRANMAMMLARGNAVSPG